MCSPNKVRCFKCLKWFNKEKQKVEKCINCLDFKCPYCGSCICDLTKGEKRVVLAMIYTYENFLKEEFGKEYNFQQHNKVEEEIV